MDETEAKLIAEQMRHANTLLQADVKALRAEIGHFRELTDHRLHALEAGSQDHETRIRTATDGVTQFKMWSGLANGGTGLLSILALIKSFLGGF